ncbi:hypothetical protein FOA52_001627 [Chlamydomonas sp. UWO 241]|jgi:proliferating cell nuclear antigen|nr:hypothetical protein FOA52_001627 [Chlamydomonas sp. UWO 241]
MFEARLKNGLVLKKLVDSVKDLCKEVNWDISSTGIHMQTMDSSHVCLLAFELEAAGFDAFECDVPVTLGINLDNLATILKCVDCNDVVTLTASDASDMMTIAVNDAVRGRSYQVDLKLMTIEADYLVLPDDAFSTIAVLASVDYARVVKDLASIGDAVRVSSSEGFLRFKTTGDIGTATIVIRHSDTADVQVTEPVDLLFSLKYMNSFAKGAALSSHVNLGLTNLTPVKVWYVIPGMGQVVFYLAPKMDDGDECGDGDGGGDA